MSFPLYKPIGVISILCVGVFLWREQSSHIPVCPIYLVEDSLVGTWTFASTTPGRPTSPMKALPQVNPGPASVITVLPNFTYMMGNLSSCEVGEVTRTSRNRVSFRPITSIRLVDGRLVASKSKARPLTAIEEGNLKFGDQFRGLNKFRNAWIPNLPKSQKGSSDADIAGSYRMGIPTHPTLNPPEKEELKALSAFFRIDLRPDYTFTSVSAKVVDGNWQRQGRRIHFRIAESGFRFDLSLDDGKLFGPGLRKLGFPTAFVRRAVSPSAKP